MFSLSHTYPAGFRPSAEVLEARVVLAAAFDGADVTFGVGGLATLPSAISTTLVSGVAVATKAAVAVQADGSVVVAGSTSAGAGTSEFIVERLTPAGVPDTAFGVGGVATIAFEAGNAAADYAEAVAVGPDGKVVVAGSAAGGTSFAVARLNSNGTPDATFGAGGTRLLTFAGNTTQQANFVSVGSDGRVTLVGSGETIDQLGSTGSFYLDLARLNVDGSPDPSFGTAGQVIRAFPFGSGDFMPRISFDAAAVGPDGKVVVGENGMQPTDFGTIFSRSLYRFNTDGSADGTFGSGGISVIAGGENTGSDTNGLDDTIQALAIGPDGSIFTAGSSNPHPPFLPIQPTSFDVTRILPNGSVDTTFGGGGTGRVAIPGGSPASVNAVAILPDGRIAVAGRSALTASSGSPAASDYAVALLFADGTPDVAEGGPGSPALTRFAVPALGPGSGATALAVSPGGGLVVAGTTATTAASAGGFAVGRFALGTATSLTPDERYVAALYRTFLDRTGSLAELDFHVGRLAALGRFGVAGSIAASPEADSVAVDGLYMRYLGRAADPGGLALYSGMLAGGRTAEDVAALLVSSDEYFNRNGPVADPNAALIEQYYQNILGRQGSNSEVSYWEGRLAALGRLGVARAFFGSAEYRGVAIAGDYASVLGRTATSAEVAAYAATAIPVDAFPILFASSNEFYARS